MAIQDLFGQPLKAVNIGLESFADSLHEQDVDAIHVDWRPPLEGYVEIAHTASGVDIGASEQAPAEVMPEAEDSAANA